jgi:type IV secretory pathway VirB2 component (pilin)
MNPRAAARAAAATGWGTGLALILPGLPLPFALAVAVLAVIAAAWWVWRGAARFTALQARIARWLTERGKKKGAVIERA